MKTIIRYIGSILKVKKLVPCLLLTALVGCNDNMWDGYQLPPPLPTEEPDPDPAYTDHPSLLTESEAKRIEELDKSYKPDIKLLSGGTYLSTLEYVVLLFKEGEAASVQRAELILKTIIDAQVTDKNTEHYGNWPWGINDEVGDRNPPLFFARRMLGELWDLQDRMLPSMKTAYLTSCERLVDNAKRRWDVEKFAANRRKVAYSNAYCLYVETLTLAGLRFGDSELAGLAKKEWQAFYDNFKKYGVDEFLSRDYDDIIFNALWGIHQFVTDEQQKKEIIEVMDHVYILKTAVCHTKLYTPVVGISRDDRKYSAGNDARSEFIKPNKTPVGYTVPEEATNLKNNRSFPFEFNGRAGSYTFTFKSYQEAKAGMGSMTGWGSYYSQQVHCMAAVGSTTSKRSTLWIPGSYIHANGFTDQIKLSTLCVYNRLPTLWHRDQWGGNQNDISSTLFDFGVGLSSQWVKVSTEEGKIVLEHDKEKDYQVYLFPYVLDNDQIKPCSLNSVQRTKSSEKYHVTDLKFEELVFPSKVQWFGVYITIVKKGETVADPEIAFKKEGEIMVFTTKEGHELKIKQKDGVSVQDREDPCLQPLYSHNQ